MKGIFVVIDGAADEPSKVLNGKTPLEAAETPHLDKLASGGRVDYCYTVKEGVAPESSTAILSLLGYDPTKVARGTLEALGAGVNLTRGDLAFRTNFATVEDLETNTVLDRRAGRTLTTKEAKQLAQAVQSRVTLPFPYEFVPTMGHRGVLVIRGGFSNNISDVDPAYEGGKVVLNAREKVRFAKPLDEEEDSHLAANLVNTFVRESHAVLDEHHLNKVRARKGLFSANFLMCRGAGTALPPYRKLKGKWLGVVYSPLEIGIAKAAKMDVRSFDYPPLKGTDVYAHLHAGLKKAIKKSVAALRKNEHKYDYFFIHIKETDLPGHDNKPHEKVAMLELLDRRLFSSILKLAQKHKARVVITPDHTTSCKKKTHTADPVPVLFYDGERVREGNRRYTEAEGLTGTKYLGREVLEKTLFARRTKQ